MQWKNLTESQRKIVFIGQLQRWAQLSVTEIFLNALYQNLPHFPGRFIPTADVTGLQIIFLTQNDSGVLISPERVSLCSLPHLQYMPNIQFKILHLEEEKKTNGFSHFDFFLDFWVLIRFLKIFFLLYHLAERGREQEDKV